MHLDNWLSQRAQTCPDRTALIADGHSLSYAELEREATVAARRLAARGVRRGATVALTLAPGLEYVVLVHSLMKLGAVAYPVNTRLAGPELELELERAQPALVVAGGPDLGLTEADLPLLGEHDLDALHCRILTSGTSGGPRPVGLTYGNHLWSAVGSAFNLGVEPTDRWLCALPLFHIGGLSIVMRSVIYGTTAVVHDGFDVDSVAGALEGDGVTVISVVATQLVRLLDAGVDLLPLRAVLVGGGPVPDEVLGEALDRGATVVQTYGLTETASQVTTLAPADAERKLGSAGRPLLTTHLRIKDGEILVQGPTVAPGVADEGGWLHTGDLGRIDDEGFLYVTEQARRHDHQRGRERGSRRDRGGAALASRGGRGGGGRPRRRRVAGGGDRGGRAPQRRPGERRRAALPLRRRARRLQGAEADRVRLRAAAHRFREAETPGAAMKIDRESVARWLEQYIAAWKSYDRDSIIALFSEQVTYRYRPHGDEIRGREEVATSWLSDDPDDPGTYDADYRVLAVDGDVAVAVGTSTYTERPGGPVAKVYDNCFVIRFDSDGRCREFTEWFMQRPIAADA